MLNKSNGNMYDWVTHTWNTVKGECPHDCSYCYMHRWGKQNEIHLDPKEQKTDLGSGNFIFVGSSCDMFAANVPDIWIRETLEKCHEFDNTYLFQTKNPSRIHDYLQHLPVKSKVCTTIETNRIYSDIMQNCPSPFNRAAYMQTLPSCGVETFVTIEPIMDFDLDDLITLINICNPTQVNIGADSGNNHLPEPPKVKILELISELEKFTIVKQKKNLARLIK